MAQEGGYSLQNLGRDISDVKEEVESLQKKQNEQNELLHSEESTVDFCK